MPIITGACARGPPDIHLGRNPHGPALTSNTSFLFKSLEVMRRNIRYKKACSHCQDQVTTPEKQQRHQNTSQIKASAEVYFMHKYTTRQFFLNVCYSFSLIDSINLKKRNQNHNKTKKTPQRIQTQSPQACHLRPRSDFSEIMYGLKIDSPPPPPKKNLILLYIIGKINSGEK